MSISRLKKKIISEMRDSEFPDFNGGYTTALEDVLVWIDELSEKRVQTSDIPVGVEPELWKEYLKTRTRLKAPNTERALKTLVNKITKFSQKGHSPNQLVEEANLNGWKSVYEPRDFGLKGAAPHTPKMSELDL